jgi:hypothetical protein
MAMPAAAPIVLNWAFALALVGSFAKLSDLILDTSQQLRFQNFLNRVTERLIDLNILRWYPRLREFRSNIPIFLAVVAIEAALVLGSGKYKPHSHAGWRSYFSFVFWQFCLYLIIVNLLARIRSAWLFCVCTLVPIVFAVPAFLFGFLLVVAWAKAFTDIYNADPQNTNLKGLETGFWILLVFLGVASVFLALSLVLTLLGLAVSLCHFAIVFTRALLWRIVTHTKGAWAAIWILISGILGVLELLVRERKT